ncbi:MAG: amidinotransferase [Chitinophagales bacterium]|nr:amidinotransferase [Chitinophagales bacterium]
MDERFTNHLMMIRPANFSYNIETAQNNYFQNNISNNNNNNIQEEALIEFDRMTSLLLKNNISITIINDTITPIKPDAIFPNNWISTHSNRTIFLYPMYSKNRSVERRQDIIDLLREKFNYNEVFDISDYEKRKQFLESTGSIIFDRKNKIAYAALSPRTDKDLFIEHCQQLNYTPIYFHSYDVHQQLIYHTNVMFALGNNFAIVCLESITDKKERALVIQSLEKTNYEIIDISLEQVYHFVGNMLQVININGDYILLMSSQARNALTISQVEKIKQYTQLLDFDIEIIETIGGGSVRCMCCELFY